MSEQASSYHLSRAVSVLLKEVQDFTDAIDAGRIKLSDSHHSLVADSRIRAAVEIAKKHQRAAMMPHVERGKHDRA